MPTFRYKGGLVCYGAFADHCSFFPMDASLIVKFKKELKGYSTAKGDHSLCGGQAAAGWSVEENSEGANRAE